MMEEEEEMMEEEEEEMVLSFVTTWRPRGSGPGSRAHIW
jgi:hypothetical protein